MAEAETKTDPTWTQDDVEVIVTFAVPATTATRDVACKIGATTLAVGVGGEPLFEDTFCAKCDVDESFWALEGSGDGRQLVVTITKLKSGREWPFLGKDMQRALTERAAASSGAAAAAGGGAAVTTRGAGAAAATGDGGGDLLSLGKFMDDEDVEDAELQQAQEVQLEAKFNALREVRGLDDEGTLSAFFDFFNIGIQLYHLNKLSGYLKEVVPVCRQRGDSFKLKGIQALAFVLWKQQHLDEAVKLFHEMEGLMGKNAALCENIAHTYNSLGDYHKAEEYFRQSLQLIEAGCTSGCAPGATPAATGGNRGGVLLGLGLVRDRLDRPEEALPILEQAYEFYKQRAGPGQLSSLTGKAGVSTGMVHLRLGDVASAEKYIREAIHTYEITCGETSPLTGGAYFKLGQILWEGNPTVPPERRERRRKPARQALKRAYEIEAMKDAFTIVGVLEIHNMLMDTFLKDNPAIDRQGFGAFLKVVTVAEKRVMKECVQDGNAACYYKAAAELRAWAGSYDNAIPTFERAIELFHGEGSRDCTQFIEECQALLAFSKRNLDGSQASPMVLQTEAQAAEEQHQAQQAKLKQQQEEAAAAAAAAGGGSAAAVSVPAPAVADVAGGAPAAAVPVPAPAPAPAARKGKRNRKKDKKQPQQQKQQQQEGEAGAQGDAAGAAAGAAAHVRAVDSSYLSVDEPDELL
jgi:tetratricopeptide (TPR) repeat protein